MRDLVERNIGINKSLIKGKADFIIVNWYEYFEIGKRKIVLGNANR